MGRAGTVEEIAKTVAFLVSEGAGYITGQNIKGRRGHHPLRVAMSSRRPGTGRLGVGWDSPTDSEPSSSQQTQMAVLAGSIAS